MTIKLMITEDHELTRQGIVYGLKKFEDIEVVKETENGEEAVEYATKNAVDVILMDISMPVMNGIKATQLIKSSNPETKVIMLTSHNEKEKVLSAFNSGADAYCMKNIKLEDLIHTIKTVNDGAMWIDPSIAGFIMELFQSGVMKEVQTQENKPEFDLTTREKEILKLMSEGLPNKEIADQLVLSLYTVKNHVSNIIQKLAVDDRTQAAVLALKEKLV